MGNQVLEIKNLNRDGVHSHLGYNAELAILGAGFKTKTGNTFYTYANVTQEQYDALIVQPNETMGKYFNANFTRNKLAHPYENITANVKIDEKGDATFSY